MKAVKRPMPSEPPRAWFLVGPTASGKSAVAQMIAERHGRIIVSADSMNLYRGLDIGTAKPSLAERQRVEYAGIDLADPSEKFSVAAYLEAVKPAFHRGRDVVVVGGTGLYVKCLTQGFEEVPHENEPLRAELEALDVAALQERAKRLVPGPYGALNENDRLNPRRLVRILEKRDGCAGSAPSKGWTSRPRARLVGLHVAREEQFRRIERRVEAMYAAGLLDEARQLMRCRLSTTARQAIGYAEAFAVLRGEMTEAEAKERTFIRTRQLAKRQMTWFRNQMDVEWIDTAAHASLGGLADAVIAAWNKTGSAPVVFD